MTTLHPNPPRLPHGAVGFLADHHEQPHRRALYFPSGSVCCHYSAGASVYRIEMSLAQDGIRIGERLELERSAYGGGVWAVVKGA